jgi:hypothetical protein
MILIQEDEQSSHISHLSPNSGFAKLATSIMAGAFLIAHLLQCLMSTESSLALLITKEDCLSPQMEKEALMSCPILDSSFSESHQPALGALSIRESRQFTKEHLACRE